MIVVHHLENSRSQRVLWLLEELGVPYEVKRYARDPVTILAPKELRAVHPLGKSPVITDGDVTVAETGAIVEYIVETYGKGKLVPKAGTAERRAWTYWLHYAEGSGMPPFWLKIIFLRMPKNAPALLRPLVNMVSKRAQATFIDRNMKLHIAYWDAELAKSKWFAGEDFSAADIMMSFPVEVAEVRAGISQFPQVTAFLAAIRARPAYQRALERGGPYAIVG